MFRDCHPGFRWGFPHRELGPRLSTASPICAAMACVISASTGLSQLKAGCVKPVRRGDRHARERSRRRGGRAGRCAPMLSTARRRSPAGCGGRDGRAGTL